MKVGFFALCMAGALVIALALGRAGAAEGPEADKAAAEMEAWAELAKPGEKHAALLKSVGTWTVESKHWMAPDAEPTVSKGKAVFTSLLDGRFVKQEFEGEFMGKPFRGIGWSGFNNATGKYEDVWIDTLNTGIITMTGAETEPGVIEYTGSFAGAGGVEMTMRSVIRKPGPDEQRMEMYCTIGDVEMKCMEGVYTRAR